MHGGVGEGSDVPVTVYTVAADTEAGPIAQAIPATTTTTPARARCPERLTEE
jgi:hypothetical protein